MQNYYTWFFCKLQVKICLQFGKSDVTIRYNFSDKIIHNFNEKCGSRGALLAGVPARRQAGAA